MPLKELERYREKEKNRVPAEFAYIIFTSGSTGDPKGVPITRANLANFIGWIGSLPPLQAFRHIHVLNTANFSFDLSVADLFYSIYHGHTLVGLDSRAAGDYTGLFRLMRQNPVRLAVMTPTFLKLCLTNAEFNESNYPHLDCIYLCGEILEKKTVRKLFERFPAVSVINAYGPTEATCAVAGILLTKDMLDREDELPVGDMRHTATMIAIENGEIVLKGPSVFPGYLNHTGGHYLENAVHCYRTGDLGAIKDNKLYYIGRKDNQIKRNGYRIELEDIEKNIHRIAGVRDCAVVCQRNLDGAVKFLKAFVVLDEGIAVEYVKDELSKRIPGYMMPKVLRQIDALPINSNGKVDRKRLSER